MKQSFRYIFIILLLFSSIFLLSIPKVYAYQESESALKPHSSCIENGDCLLVCSYIESSPHMVGIYAKTLWTGIYIYYMYTGEWQITWDSAVSRGGDNGLTLSTTDLLSSKVIHAQSGVLTDLLENGVCPNYGYIDQGFPGSNEVCFDNSGEYCKTVGIGTHFWDISTAFTLRSSKNYDVNDSIIQYFNNFSLTWKDINLSELDFDNVPSEYESEMDLICEDLRNKKISVSEQLKTYFSDLLNNNDVSVGFMSNWNSYLYGKNNLKKIYDPVISELNEYCNNRVNNAYESGEITEEERDEIISQNSQSSQDLINNSQDNINSAFDDISSGNWINVDLAGNCSDYLGDADVEGTPAYYIDFVYDIVKISITVVLILLSMFDLVNAIISENALNGIYKKLIYRLIIVLIILLLPTLITLIGELLTGKDILCGIG